ncbi:DUF3238 domain-containing protein [Halorarius halobius]|uniref:DUF3238 domain-containing protein n=1 Tax=Halorarius halobius TaxID=2962671 RepID=UPI0020CC5C2E|nr:DUF3238 domain-containing protein [Halorarius halobius]
MADIVTLRVATFIPDEWLDSPRGGQFRGDGRGFTHRAVGTGRSRVEQVVAVDFTYGDVRDEARAGRSVERVENEDGSVSTERATADISEVVCEGVEWGDPVTFTLSCSARNPLAEAAPPVQYDLDVSVATDGTVGVTGRHDGFPNVEVGARTDFGPWRTLYEHDYREAGETPASLAGPPGYEMDVEG